MKLINFKIFFSFFSYLHRNISMRFLTCEPNLSNTPNYTDEADVFYKNPTKWLTETYLNTGNSLPTHLVMFNLLQYSVMEFLLKNNYKKCKTLFHSHVPEGRVGSHVLVYCSTSKKI